MTGLIEVLFVLFLLVMLALASMVLWTLWQRRDTERMRAARQARLAEQRITEIGLQAQTAIIEEALRRARIGPQATRLDAENRSNTAGGYGPWND
jgi:type II secretory pathway pseudopilin PulG